jgi:hypothetical protein
MQKHLMILTKPLKSIMAINELGLIEESAFIILIAMKRLLQLTLRLLISRQMIMNL